MANPPDVYVMDTSFTTIGVIDNYKSLIWTERYSECGDFELYVIASSEIFKMVKQDYYLKIRGSNTVMIVENIQIETDAESGNMAKFSGRSLESILDRRVIWNEISVDGANLHNLIKRMITENIISPSSFTSLRQISNFRFADSSDATITGLTISLQVIGENLYEEIKQLCNTCGIGFRIRLNVSNEFVFSLYRGTNRSYSQSNNPYVTFSKSFDNLISSQYLLSNTSYKNASLVYGKRNDTVIRNELHVGSYSGLSRRELLTDISGVTKEDGESDDSYNRKLLNKAQEDLTNAKASQAFEADAETRVMYVYGTDFYMGDIVQFVNEYGLGASARVVEFIHSWDVDGYKSYPTFTIETAEE